MQKRRKKKKIPHIKLLSTYIYVKFYHFVCPSMVIPFFLCYNISNPSALKFQLQIERPWGHNLSHFRSKTGFQKCTQGPHFVANKLFWGCVWVYMVRLCNHFVAALFWITCDNIKTPKHFVAMCCLPRKAFCSFWRWQVVKKKTDWIATKWISRTKLGDQFSSYRMICNKAIDNMLDDQDKKEPLCVTFCSKLMLIFPPPGFSFCSCCFLRVDFQFVANQVKARGLY